MKIFFTTASLVLGFVTFLPYFVRMWKGTARPHVFSWMTWGILTGLGFVLSLSGGGGKGAWIFGLQSALCLSIAAYALFKGERNITRSDRVVFTGAILTTIFYAFTKNAVLSVVLAAAIDLLGYIPTFRKSYAKPFDEPALTYFFSLLSFLFSIGALAAYNFVTLFYPLTLVATNIVFILFLLVRRKTLSLKSGII